MVGILKNTHLYQHTRKIISAVKELILNSNTLYIFILGPKTLQCFSTKD